MENQATKNDSITITRTLSEAVRNSPKKLKPIPERIPNEGIIIFDLYDEPISLQSFTKSIERLGANYGINYFADQNGKVLLLFEEITRAGWSEERLKETVRWLILQNKFATWTLADFFSAPLAKLFPYSKYISELHEKGKSLNAEIQWYDVNGMNLWAYKKDGNLPFEEIKTEGTVTQYFVSKEPVSMPEEIRKQLGARKSGEDRPARTKGKSLTELMNSDLIPTEENQ